MTDKTQHILETIALLIDELDNEGRVITLEFEGFYLVHVYTPNSGEALARLGYRVKIWDSEFRKFINGVIINET